VGSYRLIWFVFCILSALAISLVLKIKKDTVDYL
jgi:hypothetical protein